MPTQRRKKYIISFIIIMLLILCSITATYSRYVISKTKSVTINTSATSDSGSINFSITNEKNIYTVKDQAESIAISSNIVLENKDNIEINSYYAWTSTQTEPSEGDYKQFNFTENKFVANKTDAKIGTYYLWVKVKYTSEIGEPKEVVKTSRVINVVLGDIEITLTDEESEYLTGNVIATITYKGDYVNNAKVGYGKTEDEAKANASAENKDTITIPQEEVDTPYYIYAYAEDASGNSIYIVREINNIDNVKPQIDLVTPSYARIKVNLSDNKSGIKAYTITETNTEPTEYTYELPAAETNLETYIDGLAQNKTYYLWVKDGVGNKISKQVNTKKLTYTITPELSTWTKTSTTIKFADLTDCTLTYNFGGTATFTYNKETGIVVSKNTIVNYTLQDGNNTITGEINITNIDQTAPDITTTSDYYNITIKATDTQSGIIGYFVTDTELQDVNSVTFTSVTKTDNLAKQITKDYLEKDLIYNKQYYIYVKDSVGNVAVSEIISKIDKIQPTIEVKETSSTTNSVTATLNAIDKETGLDGKYRYYISTIPGEFSGDPVETTNYSHTFTNLEDNITYYIKAEVTDLAGNTKSVETSISTNELLHVEGDIVFTNATWRSNIQTVTVSTTSGHKLRYQIVKKDGTLSLEDSAWSSPFASGTEITGLEHEDVLYIKLYDGTNTSSNEASYNVINAMAQNYSTLTDEQVQNIKTGTFDILTYSVNTQKVDVATSTANGSTLTYNYYIKNVKDNTYTLMMTSSFYDEQVEVVQAEEGQTYNTICVQLGTGASGNLTKSKNKTITIANSQAVAGTYCNKNATYVDGEHYSAIVPSGFKVSEKPDENVISKGLVLSDEKQNEFVWIPVSNAIYDEKTAVGSKNSYTPLARYQAGNKTFFEKLHYSFSGTNSSTSTSSIYRLGGTDYIEPALITGSDRDKYTWNVASPVGKQYDADSENYNKILGFNSTQEFGTYLNTEYTNMVKSVDIYGGFYCGRYETTNENEQIGSKAQASILNNSNWYKLYLYQNSGLYPKNSYYNSSIVVSSMISGSQYDAVLNFILQGEDKALVTQKDYIGNKSNALALTGSYSDDKMNNIYDLISNAYESTIESKSYQYRVYRGGGYDKTETMKSAADRTTILPTESGAIVGTRMALYLLDSGDVIPPTFSYELTQTSNSIDVNVAASDAGTGVKDYYYSISATGNDGDWSEEIVTQNNNHTFHDLNSTTTYYIRVRVSDRIGNISEYMTKSCMTNSIELTQDAITISKVYGKDSQGVVGLGVKNEYSELGYYTEYQVVKQGETFDESREWTTGAFVTGLSETDTIYARLTDGTSTIDSWVVLTLTDMLEKYSEVYTKTTEYKDVNEDIAYIPKGFKVGTSSSVNTIENGLVIEDEKGNQFVWVPVKDAVYDETTFIATNESEAKNETTFYRPLARLQKGSTRYYEGMYYTFLPGKISFIGDGTNGNPNKHPEYYRIGDGRYSEPRLVTNSACYTWDIENVIFLPSRDVYEQYYKDELKFNSAEEFGKYMNEEYTNMVNSVSRYGGFYIARTETSLDGTTAQSQINKPAKTSQTWYKHYLYQDSNRYSNNPYYNSSSVVSSMIWNSQWNATMNWILQGKDGENITNETLGNHSSSVNNTGTTPDDIMNNILDLGGNVAEWNLSGYSTWTRGVRGGSWIVTAGTERVDGPATTIYNKAPDYKEKFLGSRMTLYIKTEKDNPVAPDTTAPEVLLREEKGIEATTNSIYVRLDAKDDISGIKKYTYSISSDGGTTYVDYTAYGNTFKFENLKQNTNYKLKVIVEDYVGNTKTLEINDIMTNVLEIVKADIEETARYGVEGSGVSYSEMKDELEEQGYSLEYQLVHSGETLDISESAVWTKNQQVENLKVGDTIYIRVTDGTNKAPTDDEIIEDIEIIKTIIIDELETYSDTTYQVLTQYIDSKGKIAWIPAGFKVGTSSLNNNIDSGLVIKNETTGDEFVWIPVKHAIYDPADGTIPTNETDANKNVDSDGKVVPYKPMAKYQQGYNKDTEQYFEGIAYTKWSATNVNGSYAQRPANGYALGNTSFREPSLVTNSNLQNTWIYKAGTQYDYESKYYKDILGFNSVSEFGEKLNQEYTNMILSVKKYGGFWIGRYETSINAGVVSSIIGQQPMTSINWYQMYYNQDSTKNASNPYYGNSEIVASMIWGSQWDATLNWILEGKYAEKAYTTTGNHTNKLEVGGKFGSDYANNILDLSSNVYEWTAEAYDALNRTSRGGYHSIVNGDTANARKANNPSNPNFATGSRFTLYVK